MFIDVRAWLPLAGSFYLADTPANRIERSERDRHIFVERLPECLIKINKHIKKVSARAGDPPPDVRQRLNAASSLRAVEDVFVSVTARVWVDPDIKVSDGSAPPANFFDFWAALEVAHSLEDVLVLSELFAPGCVTTSPGLSFGGSSAQCHEVQSKDCFWEILEPAPGIPDWPPVASIDPVECVSWAQLLGFGSSPLASTPLARALASFTHAVGLGRPRYGELLFRAMQGLEAFYCVKGVGSIGEQLHQKIELWLGSWPGKPRTKSLYDSRSSFVHGSCDLEYWNHHISEMETPQQDADAVLALRLLTTSLQAAFSRNATGVDWRFEYTVSKPT